MFSVKMTPILLSKLSRESSPNSLLDDSNSQADDSNTQTAEWPFVECVVSIFYILISLVISR